MNLYPELYCGQAWHIPRILGTIRSFHDGIYAGAQDGADLSAQFEVRNGL